MAFIIVLVLLREHLLCFFISKYITKTYVSGTPFTTLLSFLLLLLLLLLLLPKSVRTVYGDLITKCPDIASFLVLSFYPMIAMGLRYNKKNQGIVSYHESHSL